MPSWDAVCAGFGVELIFSLDVLLLKHRVTAPASTSPSFCTVTNFSCPCVTISAGKTVWSLEHPAGSVKQGGREARLKGLSLFKSRGEESKGRSDSLQLQKNCLEGLFSELLQTGQGVTGLKYSKENSAWAAGKKKIKRAEGEILK